MRKLWKLIALAALLPVTSFAAQDSCDLVPDPGGLWDRIDQVADLPGMTILAVTRFQRRQGPGYSAEERDLWTDDVPSDMLEPTAICDRVQIETPLPLEGPEALALTMQQGERLRPGVDLSEIQPEFANRMAEKDRVVQISPGAYYITLIEDQEDPNWRDSLLEMAARHGQIDVTRWMVGMAGALYLVPLTSKD